MKKILVILCLLVFALPCFSADGCQREYKVRYYDDNGTQEYAQKLEKEYWDKVHRGECQISGATYTEYVEYPLFKYIEEHPIDYTKTVD